MQTGSLELPDILGSLGMYLFTDGNAHSDITVARIGSQIYFLMQALYLVCALCSHDDEYENLQQRYLGIMPFDPIRSSVHTSGRARAAHLVDRLNR